MVVQHNLQAMNSNRMLNLTQSSLSKSTEKLSSGYRINRAADDAAGLTISEKMRKQINGLTQASSNAQDAISCVQTTEGALAEVEDMLQRMNQLSVQAATNTNSSSDRRDIQDEIDQLVTEIDRIAIATKFNETYLLKGATDGSRETVTKYGELKYTDMVDVQYLGVYTETSTGMCSTNVTTANGPYYFKKVSSLTDSTNDGDKTTSLAWKADGTRVEKGYTKQPGEKLYTEDITKYLIDIDDTVKLYDVDGNEVSANAYNKYIDKDGNITGLYFNKYEKILANSECFDISNDFYASDLSLTFHVGADSAYENKIEIKVASLDATHLGVDILQSSENGIVDDSGQKATDAIDIIAEAISTVSRQRSNLGAVQNRLEHTFKNLDNVVENTTSAESAIRDTDMASEMVQYSNTNILAQAGQSMLAQANQANQGVLSLLG